MYSREPPGRRGSNRGYSRRSTSHGDWDYRERTLQRDAELRRLAEKDLDFATKLATSRGVDLATIVDVPALAKRQAARTAAAKERHEATRTAEIAKLGYQARAKLERATSIAERARHALETDRDRHPLYLVRRGARDIALSLKELRSIAAAVPEHERIRDEIFVATSCFVRAAKGFVDCAYRHKLKDNRLSELAGQINAFMKTMVKVGWDESSYSNRYYRPIGDYSIDDRPVNEGQQQNAHTIVTSSGRRFRNLLAPPSGSSSIHQPSPAVQQSSALTNGAIQRSSQNTTPVAPAPTSPPPSTANASAHTAAIPISQSTARATAHATVNSAPNSIIDPPRAAINKPGFIDNDDGANIRTGPAELDGKTLTAQPLPPATRVFVSGQHPEAPTWWYVSAHLAQVIVRGYVQNFRVNTALPEPCAKLYQIEAGDTVEELAKREYSTWVRDGHDLRYYQNVLFAVNRDRAGIKGTFQNPTIFGGGVNNIHLQADRRIWLVSPTYARSLEGVVPDGSLTNGGYAKVKRAVGHIDDLVHSVTNSPAYFGDVAGEYADAIRAHLPELIGITAGFIVAESASAFLAATPTGVGQLAAVVIQLGLAAFGASLAFDAGVEALKHGQEWLTLAWTANGKASQLAEASKEFLKMLAGIAAAALAILGARGNAGKGLKIADSINIQPPTLGWSPSLVTADGVVVAGGPVFTPGSITTAGPVDIGISATSGIGSGGSRIKSKTFERAGRGNLKWGNSKSRPTYGHTFIDHTQKAKPKSLADRARSLGHQVGQWMCRRSQFHCQGCKRERSGKMGCAASEQP